MHGNFSDIRQRPERQLEKAWLRGVMTLFFGVLHACFLVEEDF